MTPLLLRAPVLASNSTKEDVDHDEPERMRVYEAQLLQRINMLCLGKISLPANIWKQLKYRYTNSGNPYLKIAPFKEEEAYLETRIVIFHDIIYDKEIEILKKLTQPEIKLFDMEAGEENLQAGRIGQVAFVKKDKHEILKVLYRRVEHMTRLSVITAENMNDVEEGGRTVFPRLNVSVTPKRGSALFRYNLTPNGIGDPLSLHAGCPVIAGTK